jgi:hypothetical protein
MRSSDTAETCGEEEVYGGVDELERGRKAEVG